MGRRLQVEDVQKKTITHRFLHISIIKNHSHYYNSFNYFKYDYKQCDITMKH